MNIKEYIKENTICLDGGMGTLLQARGLAAGELPELWNITRSDIITSIHREYYDAGSNVVNTNTFGANILKFSREELENIIGSAIANAKRARLDSVGSHPKWIALDIGPTGRMLKPYGDLDFEDAVEVFAQTVRIGIKYGVDLIFIETMNDSYETKAALLAAKENSDLPVFVSNAYGEDGKLMTGADARAMVATLEGLGADAIGVNCSFGPKMLESIVNEYLDSSSLPIIFKPNAGLPSVVNGKTVYDFSPDVFASDIAALVKRGVRAVGGCCGTTPEYIRETAKIIKNITPVSIKKKEITRISSYTHAVTFGDSPVLIGERINPTGKKRFKEALRSNDMDYILKEGIDQHEKGVHVLDVNVGLPDIDEVKVLSTAICQLQAIIDLPLQIDTSNTEAMEAALRRYNGKALINSVNGKRESMDTIFPLAKKYGGVVIALTLDENGIPQKAEDRLEIARRILSVAKSYGIERKDIIFDPLALTISADNEAANETLKAVAAIRKELNCHTSLGVSNVSFGLPARDSINSIFFTLALGQGLSAAIMNPYSIEMMKAYHAYKALSGIDQNCNEYISFAESLPQVSTVISEKKADSSKDVFATDLQTAIVKGLKDQSALLTQEMIKTKEPLSVVREEIIPALDKVGIGFENNTVYLPQLLMSAEAAKSAFEVIKNHISTNNITNKCSFVLATVKGDIHDIGKNIVKLILENYGFVVVDLGRDVSPEDIVRETVRIHAPIVGLSALMTTTVPSMEETIKMLRNDAPWCKIIVGGAVLNRDYAMRIGADRYAKDAMEAVRYAEEVNSSL